MAVKIFVTGGTIDDVEYTSEEDKPENQESRIPVLLKKMRVSLKCDVEVLMFKDSRFIRNNDREIIAKKCEDCKEEKIVITHGTWTIPLTAKYLGKKGLDKTIVL